MYETRIAAVSVASQSISKHGSNYSGLVQFSLIIEIYLLHRGVNFLALFSSASCHCSLDLPAELITNNCRRCHDTSMPIQLRDGAIRKAGD